MSSLLANLEVFNVYFGRCLLARSLRIGSLPPSAQVKIDLGGITAGLAELVELPGRLVLAHGDPMNVPPGTNIAIGAAPAVISSSYTFLQLKDTKNTRKS